jgi:hypothetical protein
MGQALKLIKKPGAFSQSKMHSHFKIGIGSAREDKKNSFHWTDPTGRLHTVIRGRGSRPDSI